MACREALTAVIPAIAAADLPLFLHTLGQRFAGGELPSFPLVCFVICCS
jgi:hypothetical protein